jgi:hypothetical protein
MTSPLMHLAYWKHHLGGVPDSAVCVARLRAAQV